MRAIFEQDNPAFLSTTALELLNARFSGRCMLPSLRQIWWFRSLPERHLVLILPLIISPILTKFELRLGVSTSLQVIIIAIESLAPAYGSLQDVYIYAAPRDHQMIEPVSTLLLKCNKLRNFHVDSPLSWTAFLHAAQLPNLERIIIRADTTAPPGTSLPTTMFPSVKSLDIKGVNMDSAWVQSLARIRPKSLRMLTLGFQSAVAGALLPEVFANLQVSGSHRTLSYLKITPNGHFNLNGTIIDLLTSLNQLAVLDISSTCDSDWCGYLLTDADIERLVKAAPKLGSLLLGGSSCTRPAGHTMKSLIAIAKHCKHLDHLTIHTNVEAIIARVFDLDGWREKPASEDPLRDFVDCPLRSITFNPCPIPREQQGETVFALTLLRLFPRLSGVEVFQMADEPDPQWELVQNFVTVYRRIRANIAETGEYVGLYHI